MVNCAVNVCSLQIFDGDKLMHFIDGSDLESSCWMRFIQCARSKHEQNLFAFQYKDNVYYRSFKDIAVGEELLVWYDDKYLQHFGIPTGLQEMLFVANHGSRFIKRLRPRDEWFWQSPKFSF